MEEHKIVIGENAEAGLNNNNEKFWGVQHSTDQNPKMDNHGSQSGSMQRDQECPQPQPEGSVHSRARVPPLEYLADVNNQHLSQSQHQAPQQPTRMPQQEVAYSNNHNVRESREQSATQSMDQGQALYGNQERRYYSNLAESFPLNAYKPTGRHE